MTFLNNVNAKLFMTEILKVEVLEAEVLEAEVLVRRWSETGKA